MEKTKILVVEDEFITATALQVSLEGLGFEVAARRADSIIFVRNLTP